MSQHFNGSKKVQHTNLNYLTFGKIIEVSVLHLIFSNGIFKASCNWLRGSGSAQNEVFFS